MAIITHSNDVFSAVSNGAANRNIIDVKINGEEKKMRITLIEDPLNAIIHARKGDYQIEMVEENAKFGKNISSWAQHHERFNNTHESMLVLVVPDGRLDSAKKALGDNNYDIKLWKKSELPNLANNMPDMQAHQTIVENNRIVQQEKAKLQQESETRRKELNEKKQREYENFLTVQGNVKKKLQKRPIVVSDDIGVSHPSIDDQKDWVTVSDLKAAEVRPKSPYFFLEDAENWLKRSYRRDTNRNVVLLSNTPLEDLPFEQRYKIETNDVKLLKTGELRRFLNENPELKGSTERDKKSKTMTVYLYGQPQNVSYDQHFKQKANQAEQEKNYESYRDFTRKSQELLVLDRRIHRFNKNAPVISFCEGDEGIKEMIASMNKFHDKNCSKVIFVPNDLDISTNVDSSVKIIRYKKSANPYDVLADNADEIRQHQNQINRMPTINSVSEKLNNPDTDIISFSEKTQLAVIAAVKAKESKQAGGDRFDEVKETIKDLDLKGLKDFKKVVQDNKHFFGYRAHNQGRLMKLVNRSGLMHQVSSTWRTLNKAIKEKETENQNVAGKKLD